MLSPKRTKYRKYHRGRMRGTKTRGNEICFGNFGLQALEPTWITSRQIEAARRTITRYTKRGASICREVIQVGSNACKPKLPKQISFPRVFFPRIRPR